MNNSLSFGKSALLGSLAIGIVTALLLPIIAQNIHAHIPFQGALIVVLPVLCVVGLFVAYQLGKVAPVLYQIAKFGLVGILNTAIDFGIANGLIVLTGIAEGLTVSVVFKAISFTFAVINSYFWNKWWTFEESGQAKLTEFSQFLFVSIVGFGINLGTATVVINVLPRPATFAASQWDNVGFLAATFVALAWNFVGYKFWVFKKHEPLATRV